VVYAVQVFDPHFDPILASAAGGMTSPAFIRAL